MDDQAGCGPAFRVLRNLAQSWMEDASRRNNMWGRAGGRRNGQGGGWESGK